MLTKEEQVKFIKVFNELYSTKTEPSEKWKEIIKQKVKEARQYYNRLSTVTKEEVMELIQSSDEIMDYQKLKNDFSTWKLYQLAPEDAATVMVRCIDAYDKIIQHILDKLDESSS